jgi:hypothetical protein
MRYLISCLCAFFTLACTNPTLKTQIDSTVSSTAPSVAPSVPADSAPAVAPASDAGVPVSTLLDASVSVLSDSTPTVQN